MTLLRNVAFATLVLAMLIASLAPSARTARADSGSITVSPGQTRYVSFGTCELDDLIMWTAWTDELMLWLHAPDPAFAAWLEKPDGPRSVLSQIDGGAIIDQHGEWRLGFSVAANGTSGVEIDYEVCRIVRSLVITAPANNTYTEDPTIALSGTCDDYVYEVGISLDNDHFVLVHPSGASWTTQVQLASGVNTVYVKSIYYWGTMSGGGFRSEYALDPINVMFDTTSPHVSIAGPRPGEHIAGNYVDLAWSSSDDFNIVSTEIRIDRGEWISITGSEVKHLWLRSGDHLFQVRVADEVGNRGESQVEFSTGNRSSSLAGLLGLPMVAIIILAVLVGLFVALFVLKRRRAPAEPPPQIPSTPPNQPQ